MKSPHLTRCIVSHLAPSLALLLPLAGRAQDAGTPDAESVYDVCSRGLCRDTGIRQTERVGYLAVVARRRGREGR
ncbi:hypothetical protein [Archangium sp.]|uniref:hypothetical protein n=1 Tax=Archangium sp. TaxID=1872627 RepID=UPI002D2A118D|nr:hypothetical protein [Archangium sp.]HYO51712.1 hypothetical protein [Archangium sp.]